MILLDGHSLNQRGLLEPETMALNLAERDSTATVTAGLDILSVSTGDWIKDNEDPGAGIVWRVKTVETQYDTETKTLQLEHLIRSLADKIINEEVTPETIAGEGAVYCSAYAAAEYILDRQSDWVLGDFDYTEVENPYTFDGDTLLAALETVSRSLEDPIWVYDFSSYPFTLHIRRRSENVTSEMRQGRNITTLKATVDRSRMYTRFYPVGKNNLRLDDPGYVAKNENIYGIVEKTETDQSMDTAEKLYAWAQERLNRHCEPQVTITISGADLSAATGESLDSFRIGDQCRVPLPDYGTTISEKIVKLQWRDKIKDRETVTITLANTLEDVQSILQKEKAAGSRGARGGAKMAEENETLIGDVYAGLYTRISQTAYEIRLEAHNEAESMRSIISQTAESIRISVENDKESLRTLIVQTASYIRTEAHNEAESIRSFVVQTASEIRGEVLDEANSLRSLVSQTASEIRGEVVDEAGSIRSLISQTASTIRGEVADEANSLRSLVTQTASEWSARVEGVADSQGRVTAASIATVINNQTGTGTVKLDADMVQIGELSSEDLASWAADAASGHGVFAKFLTVRSLTAVELTTFLANIGDAEIDTITCGTIETESITVEDGITAGSADIGSIETSSVTVGEEELNVADISISGNTMTITYVDGTTEDFSKAIGSANWEWSSGMAKVTLSPQGQSFYSPQLDAIQPNGSKTWDNDYKGFSIRLDMDDVNGDTAFYDTVHFSTTDSWNSGRTQGHTDYTAADIEAIEKKSGTTATWKVTITRNDESTQDLELNAADIYSAARSGYTQGTFTPATVTPQGSGVWIQEIGTPVYFQAVTKYSLGSGISVAKTKSTTKRTGTKIGSARYMKMHSKTDTPTGSWYEAPTSSKPSGSYAGPYYTEGDDFTYYDVGESGTYYKSGTGTNYYEVSSGTYYEQKSSGGSGINTYYNAKSGADYYKAGTPVSNVYYTKS